MRITPNWLIFFTSIFFVAFDNLTFFNKVTEVYPLDQNFLFVGSTAIVLCCVIAIVLTLFSFRWTLKPLLIFLLITSAAINYFMQTYSVIIDSTMIQNAMQTNADETFDLLTFLLLSYVVILGVIPSLFIYKAKIIYPSFGASLVTKVKMIVLYLLLIAVMLFLFSKHYTSFFRENKPLRFYTNPTYYLYSFGKYVGETYSTDEVVLEPIGLDAKQIDTKDRKIIILVVGEAARADRFSLNGYSKNTNPNLSKLDIINLSNLSSCGTTTAISVPCMFSIYGKDDYSYKKGISTYNILDVLANTKTIDLLWRENNSDSKGVATRIPYEQYRSSELNTICDDECRDEGMLVGLDNIIAKSDKDILIVIHQMGNHGPAYYKRYPKEFEKFTPVCTTNQLEECSVEQISNAYDNAILYTDYFLSKAIAFLKRYEHFNETALVYMADHGESLGENGLYLHGMPYFIAPQAQTHVAGVLWFGKKWRENHDITPVIANKDRALSHDYLFHTLLGLFGVQTALYDPKLDFTKELP
jgi:lipid A ethanolaminephosphotransferase